MASFSYDKYKESDAVNKYKNALESHDKTKVKDWNGGQYGGQLKDIVNRINSREKFSYDLNADALYQQYKDQYTALGKLAMTDTMGQAAALTGGYGNSYASTAGNQAYQGYLQQISAQIPQLYQLAMNKYQMEGDQLTQRYNIYNDQYNNEYARYRDQVSDWYNEDSRLSDRYYNEYNKDYGQYADAYNRAFGEYQQTVAEDQWAKEYALKKLQAGNPGGGGGGNGGNGGKSHHSTTKKKDNSGSDNGDDKPKEPTLDDPRLNHRYTMLYYDQALH